MFVCIRCNESATAAALLLKPICCPSKMAQQRLALWNAEDDLEEDVDLLTIGNYGQNIQYEDGEFVFQFFFIDFS